MDRDPLRRIFDFAVILVGLGVPFRALGIDRAAIWYDEAINWHLSRLPFLEALRATMTMDGNPPLTDLLIGMQYRLGGGIVSGRLVSLAASLIGLGLAWVICERLNLTPNQRTAALIFFALWPIQFHTAQDARIYAIYSALYLAAALFAIERRWLGMIASCGLLLMCHLTALVYVVSILALAWYLHRRPAVLIAGAVLVLMGLALSPGISADAGATWQPPVQTADITGNSFLQAVFVSSLPTRRWVIGAAWLLAVSMLAGIGATAGAVMPSLARVVAPKLDQLRGTLLGIGMNPELAERIRANPGTIAGDDEPLIPLGFMALVPLAGILIFSLAFLPVFYYRTITPAIGPLALWMGAAIAPRRLTAATWILPSWWIVTLLAALVGWDPAVKGGGLDQAAAEIRAEWREGDVILYTTGTAALPFEYYLPDLPGYLVAEELSAALMQPSLRNDSLTVFPSDGFPDRYFWIWARDPKLEEWKQDWFESAAASGLGERIAHVEYWQTAPIDVYLFDLGGCE